MNKGTLDTILDSGRKVTKIKKKLGAFFSKSKRKDRKSFMHFSHTHKSWMNCNCGPKEVKYLQPQLQ